MSKAYSAPHNTLVKQDEHLFFIFFPRHLPELEAQRHGCGSKKKKKKRCKS